MKSLEEKHIKVQKQYNKVQSEKVMKDERIYIWGRPKALGEKRVRPKHPYLITIPISTTMRN